VEPRILFDVGDKPFAWAPVWASVYALVFGCLLVVLKWLKWRYGSKVVGYLFILAAFVNACFSITGWYLSRRDHVKALDSGRYEVAQGIVEDFQAMPRDGSSNESFRIGSRTFTYSDYHDVETSACFNQTVGHQGPIRPGLVLRVKFVGDCILQIEALPQDSTAVRK
jgi:energy-coupling factor transporter transmembrane protein EcfT